MVSAPAPAPSPYPGPAPALELIDDKLQTNLIQNPVIKIYNCIKKTCTQEVRNLS